MKIKIDMLQMLIKEQFKNNQYECASALGISREYLNKILNRVENLDSPKLCNSLIMYCKRNNLKEEDYIFWDEM